MMVLGSIAPVAATGTTATPESAAPELETSPGESVGSDNPRPGERLPEREDANDGDIASEFKDATGTVEVIVRLNEVDRTQTGPSQEQAVENLKRHADRTQRPLRSFSNRNRGVTVKNTFWITNAVVLTVNTDKVPLDQIARVDGVERIHPNYKVEVVEPVDATTTSESTSNVNATYGLELINATKTWNKYDTRGAGVKVAVLDTGVDVNHDDIDLYTENKSDPTYPGGWAYFDSNGNQIEGSEPHDGHGHGTHVSGTATGGNASGTYIGVAPDADLMHGKVLEDDGRGYTSQVIGGMQWAVEENADVVSMSLSWSCNNYNTAFIDPVRNAENAGTVVVSSIGNDGEGCTGTPGNIYEDIGVGAIDSNANVAYFSGGDTIDTDTAWGADAPSDWPEQYVEPGVAAPGVDVLSSVPGNDYALYDGTSMATPHTAGAIALVLSTANASQNATDAKQLFRATAWKPDGEPADPDTRYGHGIIDAYAAANVLHANSTVTGQVTDVDGEPIVNATVTSEWGVRDVTNETGYYEMEVPEGEQNITAEYPRYEPQTKTVSPVSNKTTTANFSLELDRCLMITESGEYQLDANETTDKHPVCVEIAASDVVLDGAGHELDGVDGNGTGILVDDLNGTATNVTVTNVTVTGWSSGIRFEDSNSTVVEDVTVRNVTASGITLLDTKDATVRGATVENASRAIKVDSTTGTTIETTTIANTDQYGIEADDSSDVTVDEVTVQDGLTYSVDFWNVTDATVVSTNVTGVNDQPRMGIYVDNSERVEIRNSYVENVSWRGIHLGNGKNNVLVDNEARGSFEGITLDNEQNAVLHANAAVNNTYNFGVLGPYSGDGTESESVFYEHEIPRNNTVNGEPIHYLIGPTDVVIDESVEAGYIGIVNGENVTIRDRTMDASAYQNVLLANTTSATVENVTSIGNGYGVEVWQSSNVTIRDLDTRDNFIGVLTRYYSESVDIQNSTFTNGSYGVREYRSGGRTTIADNRMENNLQGVYLWDVVETTITRNTITGSRDEGIVLNGPVQYVDVKSNDIHGNAVGIDVSETGNSTFVDNTVMNSTDWDYRIQNSNDNNTVTDLHLESATMSFTGDDVAVRSVESPPADPAGMENVSRYVNSTTTAAGGWMNVTVPYDDADADKVIDETLRMWSHNGTDWTEVEGYNGVNVTEGYVYANVTSSGTLGLLGDREEPNFSVASTETNEPVVEGETMTVNATVENIGKVSGIQDVAFYFDGVREDTAENVTLDANESQTVAFTYDTSGVQAGNHTAVVSTENDTANKTVTVQKPATFMVSNASAPDLAEEGENVTVSASLRNDGDVSGEQAVEVRFGTNLSDSSSYEVLDTVNVSLASGESTDAVRDVELPTNLSQPEQQIGVFSEDDGDQQAIDVYEFYNVTVTTEDQDGDGVESDVDVTVTKNGSAFDQRTITSNTTTFELYNGTYGIAGSAAGYEGDNATVEVNGANETVTLVLAAKPGSVSGTVTDSNGNTIEGATITLTDANGNMVSETSTDVNGAYTFQNVTSADGYVVEVEASSYEPSSTTVDVGPAEDVVADLVLQKKGNKNK